MYKKGLFVFLIALTAAACVMLPHVVVAGTGGAAFDPIWQWLVDNIQGTLGRIIAGAIIIVGIIAGIARQSIMAFAIGIGGGMGLYNSPPVIESLISATLPVAAAEQTGSATQEFARGQSVIDQMATIPSGDLKAIESKGELLFMSGNGRFIIKGGTLYDAWNRKALRTVADVNDSANRVDLGAMKINVAEFRPLSFGEGPKHVTVFVDPRCPWCAKLMSLIRDMPGLGDAYTFNLLPIPRLGPESEKLVRQLACAKDREAARDALMREDYTQNLPQVEPCDLTPIQRTFVFAQLLGVNGVPFLIASDGRIQRGLPPDLLAWLENRDVDAAAPRQSQK